MTTTFPLPAHRLAEFVASADEVLVVEEGGPFVERQLRALLQQTGRATRVLGKDTEHLPPVGQLTREQIAAALMSAKAGPLPPSEPDRSGHAGFCAGCPFVPVFQMLGEMTSEVTEDRLRPLFLADPGCAVYADLPPFELLEVKQVLGSSTAIGIGLARALPHRRVVAFTGDGSFFHSGVQGLIDAASQRTPLGVIILDNGSAAMTGFQPTPIAVATQKRAILRPDLVTLARACGARRVTRVDATNHATLRRRLKQLLFSRRLEVLTVRGKCPGQ